MKVFEVIRQVAEAMSKVGISKDNQNQQQKYKFRGIDDVYNALAPILADKGLVILPRCTERTLVERQTKNGGNLFYVAVKAEFDFVAAEDGSMHTVATYGEAMDSADKATNKAMSAAYRYACFQAFCIPTEGDNDADATTHEVEPRNPTQKKKPENKGSSQQSKSSGKGTIDERIAAARKLLGEKIFCSILSSEEHSIDELKVMTDDAKLKLVGIMQDAYRDLIDAKMDETKQKNLDALKKDMRP